jgi:hypothetical protein
MVARTRGRQTIGMVFALIVFGAWHGAEAQLQNLFGRNRSAPAASPAPAKEQAPPSFQQSDLNAPTVKFEAIPVNPSDPIAVVNGEMITRQQLADECVARKGQEILETLIARKLIDQALRSRKIEVQAAEVDEEIDKVASSVAHISRDAWLRTLEKERGISPVQYARDIIYPALALRKLAAPRVQVTAQDMKDSFEAQYGEKLRCRLIMVDKLATAQSIWEELRKNPGGFENLAKTRSMDTGSRSLGGLLAEPITRHAFPRTVSDAAFRQLVDGDPGDKDISHKPKDGDFTGPIQVAEATWIILRREEVIPAQPVDPKNEMVRQGVYNMIYEVKLKEAMNALFVDLMQEAEVDNKLTGNIKPAKKDELEKASVTDKNMSLMSNPAGAIAPPKTGMSPTTSVKLPSAPVAAPPEAVKQLEALQQRPSSNP